MMKDVREGRLALGSSILLCLDSDFDLLIDNSHVYTELFRKCPYIISTIWYSIENLKCNPSNVRNFLYMVTLADDIDIDIQTKLSFVSELIAPLLLLCLVSLKLKDDYYSIGQMSTDLNLLNFEESGDVTTKSVDDINNLVKSHQKYIISNSVHFTEVERLLHSKGFDPNNYWCIMQGHELEEKIIVPFLKKIGCHIRTLRLQGIGGVCVDSIHKGQLMLQYRNQTGTSDCGLSDRIKGVIRDCYEYKDVSVLPAIKNSVRRAIISGRIANIITALETR